MQAPGLWRSADPNFDIFRNGIQEFLQYAHEYGIVGDQYTDLICSRLPGTSDPLFQVLLSKIQACRKAF